MNPALSVAIPVYNEAGNIESLIDEVCSVLRPLLTFEIVVVDDASEDGTREVLHRCLSATPELRVLRHTRQVGQSRALCSAIGAARAAWVLTLDGDGQNDPRDIPALLASRDRVTETVQMHAGVRQRRRDNLIKRWSSRLANAIRRAWLDDASPDTGCGIKLILRAAFLRLPQFDHMHRYLAALIRRQGGEVLHVPVSHRARASGQSKYGTLDRLWVGIDDLRGVAWLQRRHRATDVREIERRIEG